MRLTLIITILVVLFTPRLASAEPNLTLLADWIDHGLLFRGHRATLDLTGGAGDPTLSGQTYLGITLRPAIDRILGQTVVP